MSTALLVIDVQNDFAEDGAVFEIPNIREALPRMKAFIDACREKGMPIIYTRHTYDPNDNVIETKLFPNLADGGLRKETHGWNIADAVAPQEGDIVINKPRYDAFYRTDLDEILKRNGVTELAVIGTMTEVCCESTARSAMYRDYAAHMLSDLNFTRDPGKHEYSLKTFGSNFGWVSISEEFLASR